MKRLQLIAACALFAVLGGIATDALVLEDPVHRNHLDQQLQYQQRRVVDTPPSGPAWGRTYPMSQWATAIDQPPQQFIGIERAVPTDFVIYLGDAETSRTSGQLGLFQVDVGLYGVVHRLQMYSSIRGTIFHCVAQSLQVYGQRFQGQTFVNGRLAASASLGRPVENISAPDVWTDTVSNGATFPIELVPFAREIQVTTDGLAPAATTVQYQQVFDRTFSNGAPPAAGVSNIGPSLPLSALAGRHAIPLRANRLLVTTAGAGPNLKALFQQFVVM